MSVVAGPAAANTCRGQVSGAFEALDLVDQVVDVQQVDVGRQRSAQPPDREVRGS